MVLTLLGHQWKAFWRSRSAGKSLAIQIFIGFLTLYLLAVALLLGFSMQVFLKKLYPGQDTVNLFCGFILYYYAFDVVMRFMFQELPTLSIQPYLAQNIKRNKLVHFLNIRSLFSFFNLLPLFLFIPFAITSIRAEYGGVVSTAFLISIIGLCLCNHFLILFIKRKTIVSSTWLFGFFILIVAVIACEYFKIFSLMKISTAIFTQLLTAPWLCLAALLLAALSYLNNKNYLRRNFYIEEISKASKQKTSSEYAWLEKFGNTGDLIATDLKLILRNKRPRSLLMFSCLFLAYGFILYRPEYLAANKVGPLLFGAMFITGMYIVTYGQFIFAWQSSHFDGLMASNVNTKSYIKSKFILLTSFSTVALLVSLFYGFMSWKIIPIEIAAYLFNIGVQPVVAVYLGTFSYKGIDLSKSSSFNYQGTGATQWIYSLIVFAIGGLFYLPFSLLISPWAGITALALVGIINLVLRDKWIDILTKQFIANKYKILNGFREK